MKLKGGVYQIVLTLLIFGVFFMTFFFLLSPKIAHAVSNTYYVDATGGLDGNDGLSTGTAWQTLTKVRSAQTGGTIHAGDTILFKKGQTFTGYLGVTVTGTAGNVLTFDAYGTTGANPIIDATGQAHAVNLSAMNYITVNNLTIENATAQGFYFVNSNNHITIDHCTVTTSVHGADISTGSFSYLTLSNDNFSGMNRGISIGTLTALDHLSISSSTFNSSVQYGMYVLPTVAITNTSITGSSFNSTSAGPGVNWTLGNGITITNTQFENNVNGASGYGLDLKGCTNITLDTVTATGNSGNNIHIINSGATNPSNVSITSSNASGSTGAANGGIYIVLTDTLAISHTTSSSNTGIGVDLVGCTHVTLTDITASTNTKDGLYVVNSGATAAGSTTLTGGTFSGNSVGSISYNGVSLFGSGDSFTATTVTASNNGGDGFNVQGTWTNVTFDHCTADTNGNNGLSSDGDGFNFQNTASGIIKNSISKNNKKTAVANVGGSTVEMDNNLFYHATNGTVGLVDLEGTGIYRLYNNVIYSAAHTGTGVQLAASGTETVTMKDNIISGFNYGLQELGASTLTEDYNLVYGATTANFSGITSGTHDVQLDPKFVNPPTDFSLQGDSPAIDAGYDTLLATDYIGTARRDDLLVPDTGAGTVSYYDIGAYEFLDSVAIVPLAPTVSAVSGSSLRIMINGNGNYNAIEYAISCGSDTTFLNYTTSACEAISDDSNHWRTYANWGGLSGFTATGLSSNTSYIYKVEARNADHTATALSSSAAKYTLSSVPSVPALSLLATGSIKVNITDNGSTEYAIKVVSGSTTKYLKTDGTLQDTEDWDTYANFGGASGKINTGLLANTQYTYSVAGQNAEGSNSNYSATVANYTLANIPAAPTVDTPTTTSLKVTITDNTSTNYAILNDTTNDYIKADGSMSDATPVWQTYAQWGGTLGIINTGLAANTLYTYKVVAQNGDGTATALSTGTSATTMATYTITASSGANGTITPTGVTTADSGSSQTYTITPASGYHIADVLVDSVSQGAITTYTFDNILTNHTISATFALDTVAKSSSSSKSHKKYKIINQVKYRVYVWTAKYKKIFITKALRQQASIAFYNLAAQQNLLVLHTKITLNKIMTVQFVAPIKMSKIIIKQIMRNISLHLLW